jgi:hypothetical protein
MIIIIPILTSKRCVRFVYGQQDWISILGEETYDGLVALRLTNHHVIVTHSTTEQ